MSERNEAKIHLAELMANREVLTALGPAEASAIKHLLSLIPKPGEIVIDEAKLREVIQKHTHSTIDDRGKFIELIENEDLIKELFQKSEPEVRGGV